MSFVMCATGASAVDSVAWGADGGFHAVMAHTGDRNVRVPLTCAPHNRSAAT